jgi:hypothetical protein
MGYLANKLVDDNNLGYYATESALTSAYPIGFDGAFAIVGATDTFWVWDSGAEEWVDTNSGGGGGSVNFVSNVATARILGRVAAGSGDSQELTKAQTLTFLNVEDGADVTDTANVTSAGALMDSEVTNLAQVKAFDETDYATAAQGATADNALPKAGGTMTGNIALNGNYLSGDGSDEGVFVAANGNVGIGTTNPSEKLDVNENLKVNGTVELSKVSGKILSLGDSSYATKYLQVRNGGNYAIKWGLQANSNIFDTGTGLMISSKPISFKAATADEFEDVEDPHLFIAENGNVGIGTTNPSEELDVDGTVNATAFSIGGTAITATAAELNYVDGVTSAIQTQLNAKAEDASDVGLGNVDNTSNATERAATATLTNKRITKRKQTVASAATVTPSWDDDDIVTITAQAVGLTLANPSGTPTDGQAIIVRILDNGTGRTIAYGNQYRAIGVTLLTTTTASKTSYLGGFWNAADSKFDITAVGEEA